MEGDGIMTIDFSFEESVLNLEVMKAQDILQCASDISTIHLMESTYPYDDFIMERTLEEFMSKLSEVFKKNSIDSLDQETLFTINMFFENSLNVSETSRKLFVHRNTLVYRLEKIKKLTGLDLREFDDAIIFKVALMVKKYLSSRENRMI